MSRSRRRWVKGWGSPAAVTALPIPWQHLPVAGGGWQSLHEPEAASLLARLDEATVATTATKLELEKKAERLLARAERAAASYSELIHPKR